MSEEIKIDNQQIRAVNLKQQGIASSRPTLKHSELGKKLLIKGENLKEFEELRAKILEETLPVTKIENILCEKIISATQKLRRAMEIERNLLNEQNEINEHERYGGSDDSPARKRIRNIKKVRINTQEIQFIIQYQLELEKGLQKALGRLRDEQALRSVKESIHKND